MEDIDNETSPTNVTDICDPEQQLTGLISVQLIFYFIYSGIFFTGIFGNVLVSIVVMKSPKNVTNLFILNLALSDIVMSLFAVPFTPLYTFMERWAFGEALCILFPFSQGVSVYMSTLTMTIIAMDRFVVIIFPYRARMQMKTCLVLIGKGQINHLYSLTICFKIVFYPRNHRLLGVTFHCPLRLSYGVWA